METESIALSNAIWTQRVGEACALPDQRLNHRLSVILADVLNHPNASIPQATGGDAGQAKATYRFYENERVMGTDLNEGIGRETAERSLAYRAILVVQDTSSLNLTGLRVVEVYLHSTLAVTETGQVLGVLDQQCWARPPRGTGAANGGENRECEMAAGDGPGAPNRL